MGPVVPCETWRDTGDGRTGDLWACPTDHVTTAPGTWLWLTFREAICPGVSRGVMIISFVIMLGDPETLNVLVSHLTGLAIERVIHMGVRCVCWHGPVPARLHARDVA